MKRQGKDKVYTLGHLWQDLGPWLPTSDNTTPCDSGETTFWQQNWLCSNALATRLSTSTGRVGAKPPQTSLFHRLDMANPCLSGKHQAVPGVKMCHIHQQFQKTFSIRELWICTLPWSSNDNGNNMTGTRCVFAGDSCEMSDHFHRYPMDSTFGIDVLRKAGFAYIAESFRFVQAMSSLKVLSLETSAQLRTRSFEHQSVPQLFSL